VSTFRKNQPSAIGKNILKGCIYLHFFVYFQLPAYSFSLKSKHVAQNETDTDLALVEGWYFPLLLLHVATVSLIKMFYRLHALVDVRQLCSRL